MPELAGDETINELSELLADERPSITIGRGHPEQPPEVIDGPRNTVDEQVDDALHDDAFGDGQ
jgi:hypothetical protein